MKKIPFILFILLSRAVFSQTIDPDESTNICPVANYSAIQEGSIGTTGVLRFEINFGGSAAANYRIETSTGNNNKPVACKVIANINPLSDGSVKGSCYIAFEDQRASVPSFTVVYVSNGAVLKTFKFPYIKSLKTGIKPTLLGIPNGFSPALCSTGNFPYLFSNMVKYKKADDGTEFGNYISTYEYSVPAGWKVGSVTSTGPANIIAGGPNETITYDQLHGGDVKIRAKQPPTECFPNVLVSGEWSSFTVNRTALALQVNGGSSLNIRCGDAGTHTFTLQNAPSCVNGYQWNIGANNGFIYNGAAAPATISTTTNSIQLTTDCGTAVATSQVSVTALINGQPVSTFSVPVVVSDPAPTLINGTGKTSLCYQSALTYILTNLPCGATVNWSVDQSGITGGSPGISINNNIITVSNNANGMTGYATVNYTVTTNCSAKTGSAYFTVAPPVPAVPTVTVLNPPSPGYYLLCPNQVGAWQAYSELAYGYNWDYDINVFDFIAGGPPGNYLSLRAKPNFSIGVVYASATSPCGNSDWQHFVVPSPGQAYCGGRMIPGQAQDSATYTLVPNPARDHLTITVKNDMITADAKTGPGNFITEVRIYDLLGRIRKQQRFNKVTSAYITLGDLQAGVYFVEIASGSEKVKKHLFISR